MGGTSAWVKFRDSAEAILGIGAQMVVAVTGTLTGIAGLPVWVVWVLKAVPAFMSIVEMAMPEPGSGPAKKTAVINSTKALVEFIEAQLTGGAKGTFDKIAGSLDGIIEGTIGMVNGLAPQIIADDEPTGPPVVGSGINAPVDTP